MRIIGVILFCTILIFLIGRISRGREIFKAEWWMLCFRFIGRRSYDNVFIYYLIVFFFEMLNRLEMILIIEIYLEVKRNG